MVDLYKVIGCFSASTAILMMGQGQSNCTERATTMNGTDSGITDDTNRILDQAYVIPIIMDKSFCRTQVAAVN